METIKLNNGVEMPLEGFGVFQVDDLQVCEQAVLEAIQTGYRLIDTASVYMNEESVGRALKASGVARQDIFLTSKAYIQEMGYKKTKQAFAQSLEKLDVEYLDLYLIHQPFGDYYGAWRAMEELYQDGRIRAIGVSNFTSDRIIDLCNNVDVIPAVNQIELHPFFQREEELEILKEYGIAAQAWAPFAEGMNGMFTNPVLVEIGKKYNKTAAQVVLRWNIERNVSVIPKSVHKNRMEQNLAIWDFSLSEEDMQKIATLDLGHPQMLDTRKPSEVKRVYDFLNNPVITSL
ncbi:aldo/keto reductase [Megasphaera hominis]|jgi:2,5-diketo-D-gluconate reductase A|uniref:Aldo/keto reductase n=1 Tax=Megasphaera hominis TaxID=159836 RepID=A0ABR6VEP0_9FIRM|nr:aldo/keto reductase [Megasphaera hominis]MBC3535692.1 aldo/keto reductase [Megasphaera hominis]